MIGLANAFSNRFLSIFILAIFVGSALQAQTLTKKQQDSAFLLHQDKSACAKSKNHWLKPL